MPKSDKTQKPTPRRLEKARREGQIAKSPEVAIAVGLGATLIALRTIAPMSGRVVMDRTSRLLSTAGNQSFDLVGTDIVAIMLATVVPVVALATFSALVAGYGQVGFVFAPTAAKPKLSNLSLKRGLGKFKPSTISWELVKTAAKLGLLIAIVWGPLTAAVTDVLAAGSFSGGIAEVSNAAWIIVLRTALVATVIAAADYGINRWRIGGELKMTVQELKQESKDSDGSPEMKAQRRKRASEISRNRMIADTTTADVVVTNPTHFAVALKYVAGDPAPRVVAKGTNRLARKIRRTARRHGVPVIEDKMLARALYRKVRVGSYVPTALFEAVALLLAAAYRRKRRR